MSSDSRFVSSQRLCITADICGSKDHSPPRFDRQQYARECHFPVPGTSLFHFLERISNILQNCTVWEGGSLGSGDLNGTAVLAYVASTTTGVDDPSDVNSAFQEHDFFNFFGVDLSAAHSSSYDQYIGGGSSPTTAAPPPHTSTSTPSGTSSTPVATQTAVRGNSDAMFRQSIDGYYISGHSLDRYGLFIRVRACSEGSSQLSQIVRRNGLGWSNGVRSWTYLCRGVASIL